MERELEIVSEASRHIPADLKDRYPAIAWRQVADLGNVLRHVYDHVAPRLIRTIIRDHLPILDAAVREMLDDTSVK